MSSGHLPRRPSEDDKGKITAYGGLLRGSLAHRTWMEAPCAGVTGAPADSDVLPAHQALMAPWRPQSDQNVRNRVPRGQLRLKRSRPSSGQGRLPGGGSGREGQGERPGTKAPTEGQQRHRHQGERGQGGHSPPVSSPGARAQAAGSTLGERIRKRMEGSWGGTSPSVASGFCSGQGQ